MAGASQLVTFCCEQETGNWESEGGEEGEREEGEGTGAGPRLVAFCGEQEPGIWEPYSGEWGRLEDWERGAGGGGAGPRLVTFCGEQEPGIWEPDLGEWGRLEDWERGAGGGGIPFLVLVARLAEGRVCRSTEEEVLEGLPGGLEQGGGGTLCCEVAGEDAWPGGCGCAPPEGMQGLLPTPD